MSVITIQNVGLFIVLIVIVASAFSFHLIERGRRILNEVIKIIGADKTNEIYENSKFPKWMKR